jgi:hypothetical protein
VRAVASEPYDSILVDSKRHPGAPRQSSRISRHLLDLDPVVHPGQTLKLLSEQVGLQPTLGGRCHMLKVAPATLTRPSMQAGRVNPVRGCLQDLYGISAQEGSRLARYPSKDSLAWKAVADEHHPAVRRTPHAPTTCGNRADFDLDVLADLGSRTQRGRVSVLPGVVRRALRQRTLGGFAHVRGLPPSAVAHGRTTEHSSQIDSKTPLLLLVAVR